MEVANKFCKKKRERERERERETVRRSSWLGLGKGIMWKQPELRLERNPGSQAGRLWVPG